MTTELPGLSTMNLRKDMIKFQEETLKNIREMQSKLDKKYEKSDESLKENLLKFDLKIKNFEEKIAQLSHLINEDNLMKEKLESLLQFKEETQDAIFKRRAKYAEFEKQINANIDGINNILLNSVIYPAVIGKKAKFQTFHEFIDYIIQEISQLNMFKNKSQMDSMSAFKKKIDGVLEAFKIQINNLTPKEITNQMIHEVEEKFESTLKLYDDRLQDTRVENANYSVGIQKKSEEMSKQMNTLMVTQKYINKKLSKLKNLENFDLITNEITETSTKVNKIFDILKDLASFHPEVKKNYPHELEANSPKKIISGVKQYIKGNINANELSTMKKFAFKKSETKNFDITSKNLLNSNPSQKEKNIIIDSMKVIKEEENTNFVNKKFISKKTVNLSKQENIISNKLLEPEKFQNNIFKRKSTSNIQKDVNYETSKMTNYLLNKINNDNNEKNNINKIIEEENEVNNNSINSNNNEISNTNNNKQVNLEVKENKNNEINEKRINSPKIEIKNSNNLNKEEPAIKKEDDIKIKDKEKDKEEEKNFDKINLNKNNNMTKIINNIDVKISNNDNINNKKNIVNKKDIIENKKDIAINTDKSSIKNNNNYKDTKDPKEKIREIREIKPYIGKESKYKNAHSRSNKGVFIKEDLGKIELSSPPNTHRKITKFNLNKSQESLLVQSERVNSKNKISEDNKIIETNHNIKLKNNNKIFSPTVKKLYNTYSNFPKINRDNNIFTKTIKSEEKVFNKKAKPNSYNNYRKKILLMKPDDIPVNFFEKTLEEMFKNNLHINVNKSVKISNHKNRDIYNGIKKLLKKG